MSVNGFLVFRSPYPKMCKSECSEKDFLKFLCAAYSCTFVWSVIDFAQFHLSLLCFGGPNILVILFLKIEAWYIVLT